MTNFKIIDDVIKTLEKEGYEVDHFVVPHLNTNRDFVKINKQNAEIKYSHFNFECFRGDEYVAFQATIWSYYGVNNRFISNGVLLKEAIQYINVPKNVDFVLPSL